MPEANETKTAEETAAAETPKKDSRIKVLASVPKDLKHPVDTSDEALKKAAGGKTIEQPRAEFIREMWATKHYDRGTITRMCRIFGDAPEMKYQIVFQATRGYEGGPEKKAEAPAAEALVEG